MPANHAYLARRMQLKRQITAAAMANDPVKEKKLRKQLAEIQAKMNQN